MSQSSSRPSELMLPGASFAALAGDLSRRLGPDDAAHALRAAGHAAGEALHESLAAAVAGRSTEPQQLAELDGALFWQRLGDFFASRGWGHLRFRQPHEGVGALETDDWFEVAAGERVGRPSCHFTTGMLANLLGATSGETVAVLESSCRSAGAERCVFLFGAPATLEALYGDLAGGAPLDQALAELA
jgi:bacteriochlorophyll 4-vinyl reductase